MKKALMFLICALVSGFLGWFMMLALFWAAAIGSFVALFGMAFWGYVIGKTIKNGAMFMSITAVAVGLEAFAVSKVSLFLTFWLSLGIIFFMGISFYLGYLDGISKQKTIKED